ncbi:MAG: hypothetical protein HY608_10775, partial [Planctomycetes bacterium]|nr:hypothetical protein [Planctomycetota bacterium]
LEVEVFRGSVEIVHGGQGFPVDAQVRGYLAPDGRCVRQGVVQAPGQGLPALLARVDRCLDGVDGAPRALAVAMLRAHGEAAVRAAEGRSRDPDAPEARRLAWTRVLAVLR